jgi:hypothetical protein
LTGFWLREIADSLPRAAIIIAQGEATDMV